MSNTLELYEIDKNRKYWVIRSGKGGQYFNHFRKSNVTAIGHADSYIPPEYLENLDENGCKYLSKQEYKIIITNHLDIASKNKAIKKGQASNINGQIRRFLSDISVDDIVVTITPDFVMAGRILSEPYICTEPMKIKKGGIDEEFLSECKYSLRRNVIWTEKYQRETIPYILENSFRNVSTVFEVSSPNKVSILNHWLSPAHICGDTLHLSSRIEAQNSIGNRSMTQFSSILDKLELLSHNITIRLDNDEKINPADYSSYITNSEEYEYLLTTQQAFMSPGDHFIQLSSKKLQLQVYAILFAALFGTNLVLADDHKDNINTQTHSSLLAIAEKVRETEDFGKIQKDLNLQLRKHGNQILDPTNTTENTFPTSEVSSRIPI